MVACGSVGHWVGKIACTDKMLLQVLYIQHPNQQIIQHISSIEGEPMGNLVELGAGARGCFVVVNSANLNVMPWSLEWDQMSCVDEQLQG